MKSLFLILVFLVQPVLAASQPKEVIVRALSSDSVDYHVYLKQQVDRVSYVKFFQQKQDRHALNKQLIEKSDKAQEAFLAANIERSKKLFKEISSMRWLHDWPKEQRKLIHYSLLRLAQLDKNNEESWLVSAIDFDGTLKADQSLFPPPLTQKFQTLRENRTQVMWTPSFEHRQYKMLYVNGRPLSLGSSEPLKLPAGKARFHFISNSLKPFKLTGKASQLFTYKLPQQAFAIGNCKAPATATQESLTIFYSSSCLLKSKDGRLFSQNKKQLQTTSLQPKFVQPSALSNSLSMTTAAAKPWYKNHWVWVGIGASAALIVDQQNKRSSRTKATHTVTKH